jgi:TatD DNase family protein
VLVDAHCHLGDGAFDRDREAVLDRARAAGVGHVVVIGESLAGSERAAAIARAAAGGQGLSATAGVHPHDAKHWSGDVAARLRELLAAPEVVAVGETGLDYHYEHSPRDAQRRAFEAQLGLAADLGKPVVVHARDADEDVAAMVRGWGDKAPALVLHSFSSGAAVWEAGMAFGAYFSFSGMITFKNWMPVVPLTAYPSDRLLVETDAPYLAPVPYRGRRNEPAYVREVAVRAAALCAEPIEMLAARTTENARRCFGVRLESVL